MSAVLWFGLGVLAGLTSAAVALLVGLAYIADES